MAAKFFCFGNTIGIFDNGEYFPAKDFDENRFREIIKELIVSKKFFSADLLLKDAMREYFDLKSQMRHYKGQCMADSEFYLRWREEILKDEEFIILSSETWQIERKKRRAARLARREEKNVGAMYFAKTKQKPSILKRHSD